MTEIELGAVSIPCWMQAYTVATKVLSKHGTWRHSSLMTTQTKSKMAARRERAEARKGQERPTGQWIRSDLRLAIYLRDEFRCAYCGKDLHGADPFELTLDHIHAWSAGGENEPTNLVTACRSCNCARGAKKLADYADAHTRKAVRRQTARKIQKYRLLAKQILSGEGPEETL